MTRDWNRKNAVQTRSLKRWVEALLALCLLSGAAGAVQAETLRVTNNGVDSPTCGAATTPCRSISQAIANANADDKILVGPGSYGDINHDGDFNDPGDEAATTDTNGYLTMITVNKRLTLLSSAGAGATVLDGAKRVAVVMKIITSQVTLGALGHGFTLRNGQNGADPNNGTGLLVDANTSKVTIANNLVRDSTSIGFWIDGHDHTITDNIAKHNALGVEAPGFQITGSGHAVMYNVSTDNDEGEEGHGFYVGGQDILFLHNKTTDNVDSAIQIEGSRVLVIANEAKNSRYGFSIGGEGHMLRDNVADSNFEAGFVIRGIGHTFIANTAKNSVDAAFHVTGKGHTFTRNVSTDNFEGFIIEEGKNLQFTQNTVLNSRRSGFFVIGANILIRRNLIKGNHTGGIFTDSSTVTITQNNIQGNGHYGGAPHDGKNCGVWNSSGGTVQAKNNFWGAATGPGPDPADDVCNGDGSSTVVLPFATKPFTTR